MSQIDFSHLPTLVRGGGSATDQKIPDLVSLSVRGEVFARFIVRVAKKDCQSCPY